MPDSLRLALGTLSVLRVPAPRRVDTTVARAAMLLAPAVGLLLGVLTAVAAWAVIRMVAVTHPQWPRAAGPAFVAAVVALGLLALVTRGLHLDGLADTADGLGSGRRGDEALAVMTRSDIGPFGVVTLVLVLLAQTASATMLLMLPRGPALLVVAVVTGRLALPWACRRGVPAARPHGLGAGVAGTVPPSAAVVVSLVVLGAAAAAGWWAHPAAPAHGAGSAAAAVVAGTLVALVLERRCTSRFGGVTGDVMGAMVEVATAAALLVLALT